MAAANAAAPTIAPSFEPGHERALGRQAEPLAPRRAARGRATTPTREADAAERERDRAGEAPAEGLEVLAHRRQAACVGEHEAETAIGEKAGERRDERRDPEARDEQAVPARR